jgi:hypothetical protein
MTRQERKLLADYKKNYDAVKESNGEYRQRYKM